MPCSRGLRVNGKRTVLDMKTVYPCQYGSWCNRLPCVSACWCIYEGVRTRFICASNIARAVSLRIITALLPACLNSPSRLPLRLTSWLQLCLQTNPWRACLLQTSDKPKYKFVALASVDEHTQVLLQLIAMLLNNFCMKLISATPILGGIPEVSRVDIRRELSPSVFLLSTVSPRNEEPCSGNPSLSLLTPHICSSLSFVRFRQ